MEGAKKIDQTRLDLIKKNQKKNIATLESLKEEKEKLTSQLLATQSKLARSKWWRIAF